MRTAPRPAADTGFPLYQQLRAVLLNQIANGEYHLGDRLPTEQDMAEQFGLSRVTVRLALEALEHEGIVERKRAKGTFLRALPATYRRDRLLRRRVELDQLIATAATRSGHVLRHGQARPPLVVSEELGLDAAAETGFFVKVFTDTRGPRCAVKRYVAPAIAPLVTARVREAADVGAALARAAGRPLVRSHGWVESVLAEPYMVMVLGVPVGSPLLSTWWVETLDGRPAVVAQALHAGNDTAARYTLSGKPREDR